MTVAADAEAARRVLETGRVRLAVVDVVMPGENGLSLARFIRERLDLGIIMLTSAGEPIDRVVGMEVGADDYLVKPFDPGAADPCPRRAAPRRPGRGVRPTPPARSVMGHCRFEPASRTLRRPEAPRCR